MQVQSCTSVDNTQQHSTSTKPRMKGGWYTRGITRIFDSKKPLSEEKFNRWYSVLWQFREKGNAWPYKKVTAEEKARFQKIAREDYQLAKDQPFANRVEIMCHSEGMKCLLDNSQIPENPDHRKYINEKSLPGTFKVLKKPYLLDNEELKSFLQDYLFGCIKPDVTKKQVEFTEKCETDEERRVDLERKENGQEWYFKFEKGEVSKTDLQEMYNMLDLNFKGYLIPTNFKNPIITEVYKKYCSLPFNLEKEKKDLYWTALLASLEAFLDGSITYESSKSIRTGNINH